MSDLQLHYREEELLADHAVAQPLFAGGVRCHGGFADDGTYVSPRTKYRVPATKAWQQSHREQFGTEILDAPIGLWPEPYPNVAQSKFLLRSGVREPVITTLTRIGTVEGFGSMIRNVGAGDLQRFFEESIDGTCTQHLQRGLFEAQARDEAGYGDEGGHQQMWFAARDLAFEHPVTDDETKTMLMRMGILPPSGEPPTPEQMRQAAEAMRRFDDLDLTFEMMLRRMISLLFIEISAFHSFAWAEAVLSDTDLVAGAGEAAALVRCIRADETPHVDYLRTALTEMRDRTFVSDSGRKYQGTEIVGGLWDLLLGESLGARRTAFVKTALGEVEFALEGNPRRDDILEEFHSLGSAQVESAQP
jgi:hypothetical protein